MGFAAMELSWGGYPGATPQRIQSGCGVVHTPLLFDHVQKASRGPGAGFRERASATAPRFCGRRAHRGLSLSRQPGSGVTLQLARF